MTRAPEEGPTKPPALNGTGPGVPPAGAGPGKRSGFVGVVGRPNVGKSTMVNWFVGSKVTIVTPHPQTTRQRIAGVVHRADAQIVFLDTPGFHKPQHSLGRSMMEVTKAVLDDADVLLMAIDAKAGIRAEDEYLFDRVRRSGRPALLAVNKIDLVKKPLLLPLLDAAAKRGIFRECVPVSAQTGEQMEVLLDRLIACLPAGPAWFEAGQRTDQQTTQRVGELIREQILLVTRQELPHAIAVLIEEITVEERLTRIRAVVFVERPGQKAIVIGRAGARLKAAGQAARAELEALLGRHVYLDLWVKVKPDWRSDPRVLRELGYLP